MVQFSRYRPPKFRGITTLLVIGCPIRKSLVRSLFATNQGLSQLTTSFIAFLSQVIHQKLFVAWPQNLYRVLSRLYWVKILLSTPYSLPYTYNVLSRLLQFILSKTLSRLVVPYADGTAMKRFISMLQVTSYKFHVTRTASPVTCDLRLVTCHFSVVEMTRFARYKNFSGSAVALMADLSAVALVAETGDPPLMSVPPFYPISPNMVEMTRFELATSCLQSTRSPNWATSPCPITFFVWWARLGSNQWPPRYQHGALNQLSYGPSLNNEDRGSLLVDCGYASTSDD